MSNLPISSKFDEIETIGRGRFGIVKKVERRADQKEFACKILTILPNSHDQSIDDAAYEYGVLSALNHPNIVQYVDFEKTDHEARIYMELCRGGNLKDYINHQSNDLNSHLPESILWSVIVQLTSALTYCHFGWNPGQDPGATGNSDFRSILHRDLKPANVFVSSTEGPLQVKLGDFGLAKFMDLEQTLTTFAGTRPYLAPEITSNEGTGLIKWTKHSDVYSLGCIIYELCSFRVPLDSMMTDFQHIPPMYSDNVRGFIGRCLSQEPSHRPDARELFQWASRCHKNIMETRMDTSAAFVQSSTIGLLQHRLLPGVTSPTGVQQLTTPTVSIQIYNEQNVWISDKTLEHYSDIKQSCPIAELGGKNVGVSDLTRSHRSLVKSKCEVSSLLQHGGFEISQQPCCAESAFSWAIRHGLWSVMSFLISQGQCVESKVWFKDSSGHQIDHLIRSCSKAYDQVLKHIVQFMENNQGESQSIDFSMTPIHYAILHRNSDALDFLIHAGADINSAAISNTKPKIRLSALMISTILGDELLTKRLLELGAEHALNFGVNTLSPLNTVARIGHSKKIAEILIQHGAGNKIVRNGVPAWLEALSQSTDEDISLTLLSGRGASLPMPLSKNLDLRLQLILSDAALHRHHRIMLMMLDWNIATEIRRYGGRSPFLLAAANADAIAMNLLIQKGANTDAKDNEGCSALHLVVMCTGRYDRKESALKLLLKLNADLNAPNYEGCTPIQLAANGDSTSNEEMVDVLLKHGADPNLVSVSGVSSLMVAAKSGSLKLLTQLLSNKANISLRDSDGFTALYYAIEAISDRSSRFRILHKHGCEDGDPNEASENTVIHQAARLCTLTSLKELFRLYPDMTQLVSLQNNEKMNALDIVASLGKRDHLEFLLQHIHSISLEAQSKILYYAIISQSTTCVNLVLSVFPGIASKRFTACRSTWPETPFTSTPLNQASGLPNVEIVQRIIESGADLAAVDQYHNTALHVAAANDHASVIKAIFQKDQSLISSACKVYADFEPPEESAGRTTWKLTPFHVAAMHGSTEALEALLLFGASINQYTHDDHGLTALHVAVFCQQLTSVSLLIEKGADINKPSKNSQITPLLLALNQGFEQLALAMIEAGAQKSWVQSDGSILTALTVAAEKGLMIITSALLAEDESSDHSPTGQLSNEVTGDRRALDHLQSHSKYAVASALSGANNANLAEIGKAVLAAVRSRDLNLLQRLSCRQAAMTGSGEKRNSATNSNLMTDDLREAVKEVALEGLVEYIRPLYQICSCIATVDCTGGYRPIHLAACKGHGDFVRCLMAETGTNGEEELLDNSHNTSLHIAADQGHSAVIAALLDNYTHVNRVNIYGMSALHYAAWKNNLDAVKVLLRHKAEVELRAIDHSTSLSLAAREGHISTVEELINTGASVDGPCDENGNTALSYSIIGHHHQVTKMLLQRGANPNHRDKYHNTPLLHGIYENCLADDVLSVAKNLIQHGADPELANDDGWNALRLASFCGLTSLVQFLLTEMAHIHSRSEKGEDSLYLAASCGHSKVVDILLTWGADVNTTPNNGHTPLHVAVINGYTSIIQLLLEHKADIEAQSSKSGCTPMHLAAEKGHVDAMQILHFYGANITSANREGLTPLIIAVKSGNTEAVQFILQQQVDAPILPSNRSTALSLAVRNQDTRLLKLLLQHGETPNIYCSSMNHAKVGSFSKLPNPLHVAARGGWMEGVQMLLKYGADVNASCFQGGTALHEAVSRGNADVVRLLLENNAQTHIFDGQRAPLHTAAISGRPDLLIVLLKHGADPNQRDIYDLTALDYATMEPSCEDCMCILRPVTGVSGTK